MLSTRLRQIVPTDYLTCDGEFIFFDFFYHTSAGRQRLTKMNVMITDAPNTNNAHILCVAPSKQASKTVLRLRSHAQIPEERQKRQGYSRRAARYPLSPRVSSLLPRQHPREKND